MKLQELFARLPFLGGGNHPDKIQKIDPNLADKKIADKPNVQWYDIRKAPFTIYGLHDPQNEPFFTRMPRPVAKSVSHDVEELSAHTSGGRVRFSTDSPYIALRASMSEINHMNHMALTGSTGFDLYLDTEHSYCFISAFRPPSDIKNGFASYIDIHSAGLPRGMNSYTVNFPLYNRVTAVEIGIEKGSRLEAGLPYAPVSPVIYYGSSITQGGCASRPGTSYQGFLSRWLNIDFINLGFSGSAKGEKEMADYIASLDMSMFVCDYDYNAPSTAHLAKTLYPLYETVRAKHPTVPYLMVSRPDVTRNADTAKERAAVIKESYEKALKAGDKNVYFLDGFTLFEEGGDPSECTVDGCHPNDLGFYRMAVKMRPFLEEGLNIK